MWTAGWSLWELFWKAPPAQARQGSLHPALIHLSLVDTGVRCPALGSSFHPRTCCFLYWLPVMRPSSSRRNIQILKVLMT
jgi:hypothetical protein